jgi:hypothetical protein
MSRRYGKKGAFRTPDGRIGSRSQMRFSIALEMQEYAEITECW